MRLSVPFGMTIGGRLVAPVDPYPVIDPATGSAFSGAPSCSAAQVDAAVASAHHALPMWGDVGWRDRQGLMVAFLERVESNSQELARILTSEQGKPLDRAAAEIRSGIAFAMASTRINLEATVLRSTPTQQIELRRRPLGVVAAITAWNYPVLMALWKMAPALVSGNTVVMKPSQYTPLTTLALGEYGLGIFPPGVFNVVSGGNEVGAQLVSNPTVRKITFTGSTETGKKIMASSALSLKRLTLELGGNDAGIVLDDVDVDTVAPDLFWAKFSNCGQVCAGLKRLYLHESIADRALRAIVAVAAGVRVGNGREPDVQMGPVQNLMQFERNKAFVNDALSLGARVVFRGEVPDGPGYFFPITILDNVHEGMRVVNEEVFGPVMSVQRFRDIDDVVNRANDSTYGLGGSIWSGDVPRALQVAARLEAGSTWVNQHPSMDPEVPFGGIKCSGLGVEGGLAGLEEYSSTHVIGAKLLA